MNRTKIPTIISAIMMSVSVATLACSVGNLASKRPSTEPTASATPEATLKLDPSPDSRVRAVDFANFAYPARPAFSYGREGFKLQDGKYAGDRSHDAMLLALQEYGDVTGDSVEEAIVVIEVSLKGTAIPHIVYVYTVNGETPKLLWAFETGDRGDGGLRRAYAKDGRLVVELYGKNKVIGNNLYKSDPFALEGACCPKFFTRARYKWQGDRFQQEGKEEVLPNPEGHGSLVVTRSEP